MQWKSTNGHEFTRMAGEVWHPNRVRQSHYPVTLVSHVDLTKSPVFIRVHSCSFVVELNGYG